MDESKDIVKSIDNTTLWQGNWMKVIWPRSTKLLTKDQTRLWFKTSLCDVSGSKMGVDDRAKCGSTVRLWQTRTNFSKLGRLESRHSLSWPV